MNLEWRLIELEKKDGLFNSVIGLAILREISRGRSKPAFVFSEWEPTVSIGCSQSYLLDVNAQACEEHGVSVLRRKSGGQSVYLDDNYIVFSAIAPNGFFVDDLTDLREKFCEIGIRTLQVLGVPASFYRPDNIVIKEKNRYKTLGNSGQIIKRDGTIITGSIRYKLGNFDTMLDVLQVNGKSLHKYREDIKNALGDVISFQPELIKERIKQEFAKNFSERFGVSFYKDRLTDSEEVRAMTLSAAQKRELADKKHYKSRGICYLYLNGSPIVSGLQEILPYNEPSQPVGYELLEVVE